MARETPKGGVRWRFWLTMAVWGAIFVSTAMAALRVQHFVIADPRFVLSANPGSSALSVNGAVYASRPRILRVFAGDFGRNIFQIPLAERRRRLLAIDWVQEASVLRVWPNRLIVRITERKPVAFVNLIDTDRRKRLSHLALIDAQGVLLERPPRAPFPFPVLNGISEDQTEGSRRVRVALMLRLLKELGPISKQISEINAAATDNLKVIADVDGRALELMLGDRNHASRFRNFLESYPEIRKHSGKVTVFDLRLDDRITTKDE